MNSASDSGSAGSTIQPALMQRLSATGQRGAVEEYRRFHCLNSYWPAYSSLYKEFVYRFKQFNECKSNQARSKRYNRAAFVLFEGGGRGAKWHKYKQFQ